MLNAPAGRPRNRGQRLLVVVACGVGAGVVLVLCMVYAVSVLQWGQQDALQAERQATQAQQEQRVRDEAQQQAALPRTTVVVARTTVAAGAPLDPNDFELLDVQADSPGPEVVRSFGELQGKVLARPVQPGSTISSNYLYAPAELHATAEIVDAEISPTRVTPGDTVSLRVTVKNTSGTRMRTMGPDPGFTYEVGENYRTTSCSSPRPGTQMCGPRPLQYATWRVAIGSTAPNQADLPYRWGLGRDLAPGETTTVTGQIKINGYFEPTHFWAALIQEPDAVVQNGAGMIVITSLPENSVANAGR